MEKKKDQTNDDVEALEEVTLFPKATRKSRAARSSSKCRSASRFKTVGHCHSHSSTRSKICQSIRARHTGTYRYGKTSSGNLKTRRRTPAKQRSKNLDTFSTRDCRSVRSWKTDQEAAARKKKTDESLKKVLSWAKKKKKKKKRKKKENRKGKQSHSGNCLKDSRTNGKQHGVNLSCFQRME